MTARDKVDSYIKRVAYLEKQIKQERVNLIEELKTDSGVLDADFLDWVYWDIELSLEIIAQATGVDITKIQKLIPRPKKIFTRCGLCENKIEFSATSKTKRDNFIAGGKNKTGYSSNDTDYLCKNCVEMLQEEEQEQVRRYREKISKKNTLKTMPYKEYLQTKHWKMFARLAKKKAGWICNACSSGDNLNVHHLTYERRGNEKFSDVVVLCKECHEKVHEINKP